MKKKVPVQHHMWTKDEMKKLYKLWESVEPQDIAEDMGIEVGQVRYMANAMRKEGFKLSKKRKVGKKLLLIRELKAELGIK